MILDPRKQRFVILYVFLVGVQIPGSEIMQIIPYKDADELMCDVIINDLFNTRTHSALMSGIPIHLSLSLKLLDAKKNQVSHNETEVNISYDVWDEIFTVQYLTQREQFHSLDSLKNKLKKLKGIPIAPLSQLHGSRDFYISMKIHIYNDRSGSLIDSIDHGPSSKKFSLGAIIRFFFGNQEPDDAWYHTEMFELNKLQSN